jgi:cytoskeletal protein CcmA (bactofilin family)
MAMFSRTGETNERAAKQPRQGKSDAHLSIVGEGMRITGELEADGVVRIEGTVEGSVRSVGQVLISPQGVVNGDVNTREAVVGGKVNGGIYAQERVEVQSGSFIDGDIITPQIVVQEGGRVNGHIRMAKPDMPAARAEAEPAAANADADADADADTQEANGQSAAHVWTITA